MPNPALLVLIGSFTGLLAGLLGAGGGFATVVLLLAVGLANESAVGISLLFTVVVGAWGTVVHLRQGTASPPLALALGVPSAATAALAAEVGMSDRTFSLSFAAVAAVAAAAFLLDPRARRGAVPPVAGAQVSPAPARFGLGARVALGAVAGGAAIGLLKGLFGVGGGFLLVPFMIVALGVPEHISVGSSLFAILLGSIAGGIRHATLGNVEWEILWYLLPGGLAGSLLGARLLPRLSRAHIRGAFVALLGVTIVYLLARALV